MTGGDDHDHKVPSYVGISCVISGYGPVGVRGPALSPVSSPVKFDCPPLPSARDRHPHLFEPEAEDERRKSLVQKKIECLYGRHAGEQWSKCNKRTNDGAKANPESGTRVTDRTQCDGVNYTPKKDYREPVFKRLDAEFIRQIDSEQGNGNDSTRNGHVLMSLAEAMVETQIQQMLLKSPADRPASDQRLKGDTRSAGQPGVRRQIESGARATAVSGGVEQADDARDGRSFLSELERTCDQIRMRMKETESMIGSEGMDEEMEGKVRCVIGKADLLLTKKLAQFRQLCLQNINHSLNEDGFETKVQDLAGFWEMVSIQVQEVDKNFDEIIRLSQNNWNHDEAEEKGPKNRSRKNSPKDSPVRVSAQSEESQAKELQRKERLREAKKKMQSERKASSSTGDADVAIFVSENKKPAAAAEAANDLI